MTRAEHLAWCKERALEYLDLGDQASALTSMISDLGKHEETSNLQKLAPLGLYEMSRGPRALRSWIEGFN